MNVAVFYPEIAAGVVVFAATWVFVAHKRRKTPEQLERERRDRLNAVGRITDGTVIDTQEMHNEKLGSMQLLIFQYDVGGVQYEASQDVTYLRQFVDLHTCRLGLPASIKYDPHNPGDSIVISETWTGLRTGPGWVQPVRKSLQMARESRRR